MGDQDREAHTVLRRRLSGDPEGERLLAWVNRLQESESSLQREVKKQRIDFSTIIEIANQINAKSLDLKRIEAFTVTMMRGQFGVRRVHVLRPETFETPRISVTAPPEDRRLDLAFAAEGPFGRHLVQAGRPLLREEYETFPSSLEEAETLAAAGVELVIPLVNRASRAADDEQVLTGLLCLGPKIGGRPFTEEDREFARMLGDMVAIALHNAQLYHRSIVDNLTQVYSRGHFDVHLLQEISRARRYLQKEKSEKAANGRAMRYVSLVMADIDHFKEFNDTYGHPVGDKVLQAVARTLHDSVRSMDIVARYGGEEFSLVFPETSKEDARKIADRLRLAVAGTLVEVKDQKPLSVTISLGVATFPEDAADIRDLVAKSDEALYRAKNQGRNKVEFAR